MRVWLSAMVAVLTFAGCNCGGRTHQSGGMLGVTEKQIDFGEACPKPSAPDIDVDSVTKSVHLSNSGSALLYLNRFAIEPAAAAAVFTFDAAKVPGTLAANDSIEVAITFLPTAAGALTGTLYVEGDQADQKYTVTLLGTGSTKPPDPALTLNCPGGFWGTDTCALTTDPPYVFFLNTVVGTTSDMKVTLHNGGCAPMKVSGIAASTASDTALGAFTLVDPATTSLVVPSAGSMDVAVRFTPLSDSVPAEGFQTGALAFATNGPASKQVSVKLQGNGTLADLQISPTSCSLESLATPCDGAFSLHNAGDAELTIQGVSVQTPNAMFVIAQAPAANSKIAAGDTVPLTLNYVPGLLHAQDALVIDWSGGKLTTPLTGGSPPVVGVEPVDGLYFGDSIPLGADRYLPVTIHNVVTYAHQLPLTVQSLNVTTLTTAFDLAQDPANPATCPAPPAANTPVAPGASLSACVHFKAGAGGPEYLGQLSIATNDPAKPEALLSLRAFTACHRPPEGTITAPLTTACQCQSDAGIPQLCDCATDAGSPLTCAANVCQLKDLANVHIDDLTVDLSGEASYELVPDSTGTCTVKDPGSVKSWEWSLVEKPTISKNATLTPSGKGTSARTTLAYDQQGFYKVGLVVYDASGLKSPQVTFNVYVGP